MTEEFSSIYAFLTIQIEGNYRKKFFAGIANETGNLRL